ncbi:MAG: hypothetical protein KBG20_21695 [Caldilineaceae bacterium]|nr:hypothetical protein [Caldilineaceae bacterium]MBP8110187.1 hypothetical protein [Caldilineaceae bacterium]MBP8125170.1 hypothetical protein [Caldilineaceae bacterium]MBP9074936.1 hypothetical protein [Caldilineaceae bacterium]
MGADKRITGAATTNSLQQKARAAHWGGSFVYPKSIGLVDEYIAPFWYAIHGRAFFQLVATNGT